MAQLVNILFKVDPNTPKESVYEWSIYASTPEEASVKAKSQLDIEFSENEVVIVECFLANVETEEV